MSERKKTAMVVVRHAASARSKVRVAHMIRMLKICGYEVTVKSVNDIRSEWAKYDSVIVDELSKHPEFELRSAAIFDHEKSHIAPKHRGPDKPYFRKGERW